MSPRFCLLCLIFSQAPAVAGACLFAFFFAGSRGCRTCLFDFFSQAPAVAGACLFDFFSQAPEVVAGACLFDFFAGSRDCRCLFVRFVVDTPLLSRFVRISPAFVDAAAAHSSAVAHRFYLPRYL